MQRFIARERRTFDNGAIGWAPGGPFDCLGPYAKVQNCPVDGTTKRYTCYATSYANTFFSIPACCRIKGKYIGGFFCGDDSGRLNGDITAGVKFVPYDRYKELVAELCPLPTEE